MKYNSGNILLLKDGRTVYVFLVDADNKCYHVLDTEDENTTFVIKDKDVADLVVTA